MRICSDTDIYPTSVRSNLPWLSHASSKLSVLRFSRSYGKTLKRSEQQRELGMIAESWW